jgi:hypothetical protein
MGGERPESSFPSSLNGESSRSLGTCVNTELGLPPPGSAFPERLASLWDIWAERVPDLGLAGWTGENDAEPGAPLILVLRVTTRCDRLTSDAGFDWRVRIG